MAMESTVASEVDSPKAVFLKDIIASPSASAGHLFSTGDAPTHTTNDGVKDSSDKEAAADRRRDRDIPTPRLFSGGVLDLFIPEAAGWDLRQALAEDGGAASVTGFPPRGWWVSKDDVDTLQLKVAMPGLGKEHVKIRVESNTLVIKGVGDGDKGASDGDKGQGDGDKVASDSDKGQGDGDKGASDGDKGKSDDDNGKSNGNKGASDGDKGKSDDDKGKSNGNKGASDGDKGSARYNYRIVLSTQAFKMHLIKAEMKNGLLILTVPKIKDEDRKDVFEIKIE